MRVKKSALSRRAFITKSTAASAAIAAGSLVTNADLEAIADNPDYYDIIKSIPEPVVQDGFIKVPDGPGLGFDLNEDGVRRMLKGYKSRGSDSGGYFEPTPEWDNERSHDRLWSMYISKGHRLKVM